MTASQTDSTSIGAQLAVREDHYCFGCGRQNPHGLKLTFYEESDGICTSWTPNRENEGFTGIAHGGIITTVLDEVMGWAVYHRKMWAVTGRIAVGFRKPVVIGEPTRASARIVSEQGRKLNVEAKLVRESDEVLLADAEAVFIKVPEERAREWQARYFEAPGDAD